MSWVAIRSAIKTKLDTLVPATLGCVFNGEQDQQAVEIPSWPAAELIRVQTEPDYFTNKEDMQNYVFAVNVYQKLEENNGALIEISMDAVMDMLMQTFLDDATLGGVVDARIQPIQNAVGVLSWQGKTCRRDTMFLRCRKVKPMDD